MGYKRFVNVTFNIVTSRCVTFIIIIWSLINTALLCNIQYALFNFFWGYLYVIIKLIKIHYAQPSLFKYIISVHPFFSPWQRDGFQTGIYSNTVVLQHHSVVMTKADKIYKVKCTYDMSSKNITFGMMPIRDPEMISITSAPEAPPPRIRILDSRSREVETVRIGDKLTFRIEIPEDSKFALFNFF